MKITESHLDSLILNIITKEKFIKFFNLTLNASEQVPSDTILFKAHLWYTLKAHLRPCIVLWKILPFLITTGRYLNSTRLRAIEFWHMAANWLLYMLRTKREQLYKPILNLMGFTCLRTSLSPRQNQLFNNWFKLKYILLW